MSDKRIVLTGGGTAGHVSPNIALLPALKKEGYEIFYIGSKTGPEKGLAEDAGLTYYGVSTGKFRRYFDLKNLTDPFKVISGYFEAKKILKKLSPDVIFSKGGFVSVPVVKAASSLKIPCVIHESDYTPGLANKLCFSSARIICCNFPETVKMLPAGKSICTGTPVREMLKNGNADAGKKACGFEDDKPVIMVTGGSQGAAGVNAAVRQALPELLKKYNVVHLCGKGKLDESLNETAGYKQFEYVKEQMADLFALADIVISRAGANSIYEILALKKPHILIPLPTGRGDQKLNAKSFESLGYSVVIMQEDLTPEVLSDAVDRLYKEREKYIDAMTSGDQSDPIGMIIDLLKKAAEGGKLNG